MPMNQAHDRASLIRRGVAAVRRARPRAAARAHRERPRRAATLNLVAYSTPKPVMAKIITDWQATPHGQGVSFTQSYGPSTSQAKAVAAGQPADLVFLSAGDDVNLLVDAGLVNPNWDQQGYNGIAANTVVVFALRDGNPKKIKGWDDLDQARRAGDHPEPVQLRLGEVEHPRRLLARSGTSARPTRRRSPTSSSSSRTSSSQDTSGSNATNTFLSGKGDVLITYESEAINARLKGKNIQYVIPRQTMLIQLPIAVLQEQLEQGPREQVHPVHQVDAGAGGVRPVRLPAGQPGGAEAVRRSSRSRPGPVHDRRQDDRRLARRPSKRWFDPRTA